ncbi:unnamed protein product [Medioppia subpectinata]|uniref:Uncharacterized protein n=1 Tax=Medioppia subpectinata TaxID=1979941 RepID=A0A7R9PTP8_9ACAR|nr:unnamed protein product [Medioppia subpectinata]CAG2099981.1 unnamed protein product [Medioppia subpectinata]
MDPKAYGKELVDHPIFQFERRVDEPKIYNRETMLETIENIPRIAQVKQVLEDTFIKERILSRKEESKARDLKFIEAHKRLLKNFVKGKEENTEKKQQKDKQVEYEIC